ncbi:MAG: T9SS type A sorting domain-containing protein, partial [Ignavibacterium sp.]
RARLLDIADMDLDGDNDVVATANEAGVVAWFENRLPDNWARHNIDVNIPSANDVCVANIFSDDTLDVLASGFSSNILNLYISPPVSVELLSDMSPTEYKLIQNYPNPFNPNTTIRFDIPEFTFITIKVFDILGSEIEILVNEEKQTGTYQITWYAENLTSGIYFYRLQAGSFVETKKLLLIK